MESSYFSNSEKKRIVIAIGSTVKIKDGSYMYTHKNGKKQQYGKFNSTNAPGLCRELFVVLAQTENYGPIIASYMSDWGNEVIIDTKIINMENGEVWYCNANVSLNIVEDAAKYASVHICSTQPPIDGRTYSVKVQVKYFNTITIPGMYDNCIICINNVKVNPIHLLVPVVEIVYVPVAVVKYVPVTIVDCFLF